MRRQPARSQRRGLWVLLVFGIGASLGLGLLWLRSSERAPAQTSVVGPSLPRVPASTSVAVAAPAIRFVDVTATAGIAFTHVAGARGDKWYPETIGAGVAFLDYDGDGWPDIILISMIHSTEERSVYIEEWRRRSTWWTSSRSFGG